MCVCRSVWEEWCRKLPLVSFYQFCAIIKQISTSSDVPAALSSSALPLINSSVEAIQLNPGVVVANLTPSTSEVPAVVSTITILPQSSSPEASESEAKRPRVGRPRTKPHKEKTEWHQHLGGVRHCRWEWVKGLMLRCLQCWLQGSPYTWVEGGTGSGLCQ